MISDTVIYGTGTTGFIGSHLMSRLLGDIRPIPHELIQKAKLKPFDYFYYLSSYGNLATQTDEDAIFKSNVEDVLYILKQIKNMQFKSFVFVSTSSVKLRTQTTYSRSKNAIEQILLAVMEKRKLPICIVRPYSVFGKNDKPEHLIPTLIRSCFEGEEADFVPTPVHDWIAVDDVVDCIINLSQNSARGIFEAGNGHAITNQEVLKTIERVTGKKAKVHVVSSMRSYDNDNWVSTNFRARSFGWMPQRKFEDVIKEIVEDYLKNPAVYGKVEQ